MQESWVGPTIARLPAIGTTSDETPARLKNTPSWLLTHVAVRRRASPPPTRAGTTTPYWPRWTSSVLRARPRWGGGAASTAAIVVATVNELVEKKLAERTPDPADRRRNTLSITRAGLRKLRQLETMVDGVQDELLAALSAAERDELTRLLTRVLDHHTAG